MAVEYENIFAIEPLIVTTAAQKGFKPVENYCGQLNQHSIAMV